MFYQHSEMNNVGRCIKTPIFQNALICEKLLSTDSLLDAKTVFLIDFLLRIFWKINNLKRSINYQAFLKYFLFSEVPKYSFYPYFFEAWAS